MADQKISSATGGAIALPHLDDVTVWVDTGATTHYKITADVLAGLASHGPPQFRLSLETGVPNSITDQLAKGTLYYTPSTPSGMPLSTIVSIMGKCPLYVPVLFVSIGLLLGCLSLH